MRKAAATITIPQTDSFLIKLENDNKNYQLLVRVGHKVWHEAGYIPVMSVGKKIVVDLDDTYPIENDMLRLVKVMEFDGNKKGNFPTYVNRMFLNFKNPTIIDNE